jgi:hypothetical protein
MSVYNDYMIHVSVYFVKLAELYCNLLSQGVEDCCVRTKMNLLAMYLDTIPRVGNENCLTDEQLAAITNHINILCGYPGWGTLTSTNVINPPVGIAPAGGSTQGPQAWNTTIGTAPTVISFTESLGTSGTSWAMTYIATTSGGDSVFVKSITNRTANGFTVDAYEDDVHFEGSATLITS